MALLPFKYPINCDTLYFGGIATNMWIWSGIKCPSSISTPFHSHRFRIISCISVFMLLYITFLRYFGVTTYFGCPFFLLSSFDNPHLKAKEFGIRFFQVHNFGLLRADIQSKTVFKPSFGCMEQFDRILIISCKDFEIICESD